MSEILSVCQHSKTKTAETKIPKLGTGIVHHDISPPTINIRLKGQRSQGHKVQKDDQVTGRSDLCTLSGAQPVLLEKENS